jgi:BlaI family transcriptional regulator, penicillinase repressor
VLCFITLECLTVENPQTPLEQLVLDYVWTHPDCTAEACREGLARERALKDSTIRTILRKLEEKAYVSHLVEGRTFVYRAAEPISLERFPR